MDIEEREDQIADPQKGEKVPLSEETKTTYKSYKKKYKKMRIKFDAAMNTSNELFLAEQQALATIKRIAQQNNQTLDVLLDVNNSAQIPAEKRFDLSTVEATFPLLPSLISPSDLLGLETVDTPEGQALYTELLAHADDRRSKEDSLASPLKPFSTLQSLIPHHTLSNSQHLPPELLASLDFQSANPPLRHLTSQQRDELLDEIDTRLGLPSLNLRVAPSAPPPPPTLPLTNQELSLRNPHSVYNWLRQHEPRVFLQDGEGSEKSSGKPGALRGAGKRIPPPAPSKVNELEFVEEDGLGYEGLTPIPSTTAKGKRKRGAEDEDSGYHPKQGRVEDGKGKKQRKPRAKKPGDEGNPSSATKRSRKSKGSSGETVIAKEEGMGEA